jgi:hypothetical protein
MEIELYRGTSTLTTLHYRNVPGQYSWVLRDFQGDLMDEVEVLTRDALGGRALIAGQQGRTRRIVIVLDVQGTSMPNLHAAIRELETHTRWRRNEPPVLILRVRAQATSPWNFIGVILEQMSAQFEDDQYRATITMRFACLRIYWREFISTVSASNSTLTGNAFVVDLSTMTFTPITGIGEIVFNIDYRGASNEWVIFTTTQVWRAPVTGGTAALVGSVPGSNSMRGCVAHDGSILAVAQGVNQLVRFTYPSSSPAVLGAFNGLPFRVRRFGDSYASVGEFSQYQTTGGLAGMVITNVAGAITNTFSPFPTSVIFPGGGRIRDVLLKDNIGIAIAYRQPSPSQSWVVAWSGQVAPYYIAEGASTWGPYEIDQSSPIDDVTICAESSIHSGRTFNTLCRLKNLSGIVPYAYPTVNVGGVQDGCAVERFTFATSEPRKAFRLGNDGTAMPMFTANINSVAVRRVGNLMCVGYTQQATVWTPLTVDVSAIPNDGTTAEVVPRLSTLNVPVFSCYSKVDSEILGEVLDPQTQASNYEPKYHGGGVVTPLPGTRYERMFRGSENETINRYWFAVGGSVTSNNVTINRYKHDWR